MQDSLSLVHENLTMTSTMETSGGFGAMMDTSGRSCTDDFGDPDSDCDGVGDDFDDCPGTAEGAEVDGFGCSDAQNGGGGGGDADTDGDGIPDSSDACPNDYADSSNDADVDGCPITAAVAAAVTVTVTQMRTVMASMTTMTPVRTLLPVNPLT